MNVLAHYEIRACTRCGRQCQPSTRDFWACPEHGEGYATAVEVVPSTTHRGAVEDLYAIRDALLGGWPDSNEQRQAFLRLVDEAVIRHPRGQ